MTVWLGKGLLFLACLWLGWDRTRRRKQRVACLRAFRQSVADLGRELTFSLAPVDSLLDRMGEGTGPVPAFFALCRERFRASGGESWAESWRLALTEAGLPVAESDLLLLVRAGEILGRWDGESQQKALSELLARLDETIFDSREEEKRLFRVDLALGAAAGLFCVLLL